MRIIFQHVVGTLFLQNGEDNSYDPEDFMQELDVGSSTPHFRISVADDDGGIPGSLFACAVWNRFIATHFAKHSELVEGRRIVEFDAASALSSLVALHFGAKLAVMTDYPNDFLLKNIETNIKRNAHLLGTGRRDVRGHLWGTRFEVAVVAECLWLHNLHEDLLKSIDACLSPGGKVRHVLLLSKSHCLLML
ncbi:uncharacterized protein PITG_05060 [Phytophthora infestans T30-4]|uniref:Uncharacterized protein n=1 Tax=Phytophthora infestans (strain T30-4) TaxID=403677 RepID=D0N2P2_PHYIT|nr:uncharacterized protein PITG_05060 [Phytophthora infestans T30-4]EEY68571.1 conserved hypothetical protein [Phytophthora infestans T30-4]|eukprot:XP_002905730.1 conserved hypothetical protein [Phytophthora infestans T30-4]